MGPIPDSDNPLLEVCLGITPDGLGRLSLGELGSWSPNLSLRSFATAACSLTESSWASMLWKWKSVDWRQTLANPVQQDGKAGITH